MSQKLYQIHMVNDEGFPPRNPFETPTIVTVDHNILFLPDERYGVDITVLDLKSSINKTLLRYPQVFNGRSLPGFGLEFHYNFVMLMNGMHPDFELHKQDRENLGSWMGLYDLLSEYGVPALKRKQSIEMCDFISEKSNPVDLTDDPGIVSGPFCKGFYYSSYEGDEYHDVIDSMKGLRRARRSIIKRKPKIKHSIDELDRSCRSAGLI